MNPGTLIHYGANKYDPSLFRPIKNDGWAKPIGGLWASPLKSHCGWREWCKEENFRLSSFSEYFTLSLKDYARVLVIDDFESLLPLPAIDGHSDYKIVDFESITSQYDAIWLTPNGEEQTRFSRPVRLYGWDCESVLILNPDCFNIIEEPNI